jgi:hypothetical protein
MKYGHYLPALDRGISITLEGQGVLADGRPPDILDGAASLAVDTLDLVLADNGVLERGAVLQDEDGIAVIALFLAGTLEDEVQVSK